MTDHVRQVLLKQKQRIAAATENNNNTHKHTQQQPTTNGQHSNKKRNRQELAAQTGSRTLTQTEKKQKKHRDDVSSSSSSSSALSARLSSARFRWLNEQLYTTDSVSAFTFFNQHPDEFTAYHTGFKQQVSKWPMHPLDNILTYITETRKAHCVIADMGCGEARLADKLHNTHTIHSFDLVAINEHVTACNIAHTPLSSSSVDVCVFCLSLMGTDYQQFIEEATRVLKPQGELIIAEVSSRLQHAGQAAFMDSICKHGYRLKKEIHNAYFVCLWLVKLTADEYKQERPHKSKRHKAATDSKSVALLTPCIYKKR